MLIDQLLATDSKSDRTAVLAALAFLIASIALLDLSEMGRGLSLGFLYLFPILVGALYLTRKEILGLAVLCALLRETLGPFSSQGLALRSGLGLLAFAGCGLFVVELAERRRRRLEQQRQLEEHATLRETAEQQLRALIETSPAAILTTDMEGSIRLANQAAHDMLGLDQESLSGEPIGRFLPLLAGVPPPDGTGRIFRTVLECKGRRGSGEVFPAHVWLSSYTTVSGPMLAGLFWPAVRSSDETSCPSPSTKVPRAWKSSYRSIPGTRRKLACTTAIAAQMFLTSWETARISIRELCMS